jgi:hypothetical protein
LAISKLIRGGKMARDDKKNGGAGALFIPAGLFIGFGVGFLVNNLPAGIFLGLGFGFVGFAITAIVKKKK